MVANELVLLDQVLQQRQRQHPTQLAPDRAFDLFVCEHVLRNYGLSTEEMALGIVTGEKDGALGGIYVFLDEKLLSESSDVLKDEFAPGKVAAGTSLTLWLIHPDQGVSFTEDCLTKVSESLRRLLSLAESDDELATLFSLAVVARTGMFRSTLQKLAARNLQIDIHFSYVTRGQTNEISSTVIDAGKELERQLSEVLTGAAATVEFVGAAELWEYLSASPVIPEARTRTALSFWRRKAKHPKKQPKLSVESKKAIVAKRLLVWGLFGAVFGLLPLFAQALKEVLHSSFDINNILKSGELFIVAAVLSAGALGELIATVTRRVSFVTIIAGFFCLAAFAGNTIAYVVADNATVNELVKVSIWFFPPTLMASGVCIGVAASR